MIDPFTQIKVVLCLCELAPRPKRRPLEDLPIVFEDWSHDWILAALLHGYATAKFDPDAWQFWTGQLEQSRFFPTGGNLPKGLLVSEVAAACLDAMSGGALLKPSSGKTFDQRGTIKHEKEKPCRVFVLPKLGKRDTSRFKDLALQWVASRT